MGPVLPPDRRGDRVGEDRRSVTCDEVTDPGQQEELGRRKGRGQCLGRPRTGRRDPTRRPPPSPAPPTERGRRITSGSSASSARCSITKARRLLPSEPGPPPRTSSSGNAANRRSRSGSGACEGGASDPREHRVDCEQARRRWPPRRGAAGRAPGRRDRCCPACSAAPTSTRSETSSGRPVGEQHRHATGPAVSDDRGRDRGPARPSISATASALAESPLAGRGGRPVTGPVGREHPVPGLEAVGSEAATTHRCRVVRAGAPPGGPNPGRWWRGSRHGVVGGQSGPAAVTLLVTSVPRADRLRPLAAR